MGEELRQSALRKATWRLVPFLFLLYIVNILDRVNVGFARLQMLDDLGLDESVYALGAGIFYIGYLLFEVPSNLILARVGARRWIGRILISWGLITCAMAAVRGPWSFYALRILLGFAEAGFFPGVILYLTYWFPARERARTVAWFMTGSPVAGALGGPVSGAILQYLDLAGGLRGWQWLFLLEGMPAVLLGVVAVRFLTDRPAQAAWLTADERGWLAERLAREESALASRHGLTSLRALADRRVWLLILLYFTVAAGSNSFGFYLAEFLRTRFPGRHEFQIGLLAVVPNVVAVTVMILNGTHSDRTGERRWHVALPAFLSAAGWTLFAVADAPATSLLALALIQAGIMAMLPTFWTLPTALLSGTAAAGGIAFINSVGNLGGFAGPNVVGQIRALTGEFTGGLLAMAGIMAVGGFLALCARHEQPADDRQRAGAGP
jgi:ACS family tartrate transporter-like MFS transporter